MPRAFKKNRCQKCKNNYYTQSDYYDMPTYAGNEAYQQVFAAQFQNPIEDNMNSSIERIMFRDHGPEPYVVNITEATKMNDTFRTALWTGDHLQLTLVSLKVGEDIGLEIHPDVDQFLRIEEGQGLVMMGENRNNLNFQRRVKDDYAIFIPAGIWHNVVNTGNIPLKLYSIYAPPQHPHGTVHLTKADAEAAESRV